MPDLPRPVVDLAVRLGVRPDAPPAAVRFTQVGRMRQDGDGRWMRFTARQESCVSACRFAWHARIGPAGLVRVSDALGEQGGYLRARLLGVVPLAAAAGPEVTRGELMRYLAELPWCPDAILHNRTLRWEVLDEAGLAVSAGDGAQMGRVFLDLDGEGRIAAIHAPDRPRSVGKKTERTPWWGRFADFREVAGRQIPFRGEVGWLLGGQEVTVWQGRLDDWQAVQRRRDVRRTDRAGTSPAPRRVRRR